jgi:hypothetical protein
MGMEEAIGNKRTLRREPGAIAHHLIR